jgi:hypothetical protein
MIAQTRYQMPAGEFSTWEVRQPLRYDLVDGSPVRRPESEQASARIRRLTEIAGMVFSGPAAADAWLAASRPKLSGLRPAELAA